MALTTLQRGRSDTNRKHGHVIGYRHVVHALHRKPMVLLASCTVTNSSRVWPID